MKQEKRSEADLKNWFFRENMRLEDLRLELSKASSILRNEQEQFSREKEEFKEQMHDWTQRIKQERKKLEEEQSFFDKKFKILEMGFKQLDADRKSFEAKKRAFDYRQSERTGSDFQELGDGEYFQNGTFFFRGVNHPLALKKRYKDLIKIYHPDNLCGDKTMLQQINKEYEQLKKVITYQKKA